MGTPTFQRRTAARVREVAPALRFVAFYHRDEERLNACMHEYAGRSFVYILSATYNGEEYFLYVGKTKTQYARCLTHSKKYAYMNIYLFECTPKDLTESESAVIRLLCPLFNRHHNPCAERYKMLLEIDYEAVQDAAMIQQYLERLSEYRKTGLFGFSLPHSVFAALEKEAQAHACNCSDYLLQILEKDLNQKITEQAKDSSRITADTNLITAKQYGKLHGRSREQVKAYLLQQDRIPGTAKIGRDWVIPRDAKFPEDRREAGGEYKTVY